MKLTPGQITSTWRLGRRLDLAMPATVGSVLIAVAWLLVVFAASALWFFAISNISSRAYGNLFTKTQLVSMAAAISVVAIISVGAAGALLIQERPGASSAIFGNSVVGTGPLECRDLTGSSFVFSFGLERASHSLTNDAASRTDGKARGACPTHR